MFYRKFPKGLSWKQLPHQGLASLSSAAASGIAAVSFYGAKRSKRYKRITCAAGDAINLLLF